MSQRSRWLQRSSRVWWQTGRRGWLRWSTHLSHARPQADARRHRRWAKPCQGTGIWCPQHVHVVFLLAKCGKWKTHIIIMIFMISNMLPSQVHHEIWNRYQLSHESHGARSICPGRSSPGKALSIAPWVSEEAADDPLKRNQAMGLSENGETPNLWPVSITIMGNYGKIVINHWSRMIRGTLFLDKPRCKAFKLVFTK